jgi:Uma2 family endonuclease
MISATSSTQPGQAEPRRVPAASVPPLENGDRLTRREYERRYEATPDLRGVQLIEGIVYMPLPVPAFGHGVPHGQITTWLGAYCAATPGTRGFSIPTLRLDDDNEPEPDVVLMIDPMCGGQSRISADDYLEGAPELIVEVVSNRACLDLHEKFNVYQRTGVQEYLVWQVREQELHWWQLSGGVYSPLLPGEDGVLHSIVFPGLWLSPAHLLRDDLPAVLAAMQQGLRSPEHAAFVKGLSLKQTR